MTKFNTMLGMAVLLASSFTASAQENRRYEDKAHHDTHEWNSNEDQAYHRYLTENHRKSNDFDKASKREQSNYWRWRHAHADDHGGEHKDR